MTENQSFAFEVKSFSNWNHSSDDPKQKGEDGNEIKLDYFYNLELLEILKSNSYLE